MPNSSVFFRCFFFSAKFTFPKQLFQKQHNILTTEKSVCSLEVPPSELRYTKRGVAQQCRFLFGMLHLPRVGATYIKGVFQRFGEHDVPPNFSYWSCAMFSLIEPLMWSFLFLSAKGFCWRRWRSNLFSTSNFLNFGFETSCQAGHKSLFWADLLFAPSQNITWGWGSFSTQDFFLQPIWHDQFQEYHMHTTSFKQLTILWIPHVVHPPVFHEKVRNFTHCNFSVRKNVSSPVLHPRNKSFRQPNEKQLEIRPQSKKTTLKMRAQPLFTTILSHVVAFYRAWGIFSVADRAFWRTINMTLEPLQAE